MNSSLKNKLIFISILLFGIFCILGSDSSGRPTPNINLMSYGQKASYDDAKEKEEILQTKYDDLHDQQAKLFEQETVLGTGYKDKLKRKSIQQDLKIINKRLEKLEQELQDAKDETDRLVRDYNDYNERYGGDGGDGGDGGQG